MKRKRILFLVTMTVVLSTFEVAYADATENRFVLVRGRHVDVCEAYLARLNATHFEHPEFCDRPENISVQGFSSLRRVPLTPAEAFELWPSVGAMEKPAANTEDWTLAAATGELGRTILAWRYDPNVDIQNDGSSRQIIVWRGSRIKWGIENSNFACGLSDRRTPQLAFILNGPSNQVDEIATKRVFWRTDPAIFSYTVDGKTRQKSIDLPVGQHMSIFKFKGLYYFDTFYDDDGWGDYLNKRQKDEGLENTLAVFLNLNGKTREMCELRLN
jgi:hypothetical protein